MLTEREATARVRAKGFLGTCLCGGAAGCVSAYASGGGWSLLPVGSMVLVLLGNVLGGFLGLFLRTMLSRGQSGASKHGINTEASLILSAYGAFLGVVVAMLSGMSAQAHWWAAGGAATGAAMAGFFGELLVVLVFLMALDSMDEAGRAAARENAAKKTDQALMWPGDENDDPKR
ncbi:MAG: hypothetical protein KKE73_00205 [Proteobacteria bacterium]|nr:hypothetical protein [Pseudomonadota bacterium]